MFRCLFGKMAAVGVLMAAATTVNAVPLNLLPQLPDIMSDFIAVDYDAFTGAFTAVGTAQRLNQVNPITNGAFELNATIDSFGVASGGSLTIAGTVDVPGEGSKGPSLLVGTLAEFGFPATTGSLDFVFDLTGGDLADLYGDRVAVILDQSGFAGTFLQSFGAQLAVADSVAFTTVPEPVTAAMGMLAMTALAGFVGSRRARAR